MGDGFRLAVEVIAFAIDVDRPRPGDRHAELRIEAAGFGGGDGGEQMGRDAVLLLLDRKILGAEDGALKQRLVRRIGRAGRRGSEQRQGRQRRQQVLRE